MAKLKRLKSFKSKVKFKKKNHPDKRDGFQKKKKKLETIA